MLPILTAALLLGAPPPMPSEKTPDRELLPMPRRLGDSTAQRDCLISTVGFGRPNLMEGPKATFEVDVQGGSH